MNTNPFPYGLQSALPSQGIGGFPVSPEAALAHAETLESLNDHTLDRATKLPEHLRQYMDAADQGATLDGIRDGSYRMQRNELRRMKDENIGQP